MSTAADRFRADPRNRWRGVVGALLIEALLAALVLAGLATNGGRHMPDTLAVFTALPPSPPPPPPVRHNPRESRHREGASAPPNIRSHATELELPTPLVQPLVPPPPVVVALHANTGLQASQGAAPTPGPGTGAGGVGNGTGSGDEGDGDGDGGQAPMLRHGRLRDSDYPREAGAAGIGGSVGVRYLVNPDGHVSDCQVTRSSGSTLLDRTTCRLIEERFQFRPALDGARRPVPSYIVETHSWSVRNLPPDPADAPPPEPPRRRWRLF